MSTRPSTLLEAAWVRGVGPDGTSNNNLHVVIEVTDPDESAVMDAIGALSARHTAMRTRFADDGTARLVAPPEPSIVSVIRAADPEEEARRLIREDVGRPTALIAGPLWRVTILRLPNRLWVAFVLSHAISDGWSMAVIRQDFVHLYSAYATGRSPIMRPVPQPRDVQAREQAATVGPDDVAYWRDVWAAAGTDVPRLPDVGVMEHVAFPPIPARDVAVLLDTAARVGATAGSAVRAAVLAALAPALGEEVVCGALMAARPPGLHSVVGVMADHEPFRADLRDDPSYADLAQRVHASLAQTRRHAPWRLVAAREEQTVPDLDVSVMYLPTEPLPPRRVAGSEVREVRVLLPGHRPWAARGCPGLTRTSYTVWHDHTGFHGEIYGCGGSIEGTWSETVPRLRQLGHAFSETVRRIARNPTASVRHLSASGG
jgi:hypothetical protein